MSLSAHAPAVDPRISLGSVLAIVSIAVSVTVSWANLSSAGARAEATLASIQRQLDRNALDHDQIVQLAADVRVLLEERAKRTAPPAP
jgi:hypothetical protein